MPEDLASNTKSGPRYRGVVLVSHGFQQDYERGFANGLALNHVPTRLIGSDESDPRGLHPAVDLLNLRGSQRGRRSVLTKALNLLRYHAQLLVHVFRNRPSVIHVNGLLMYPVLMGILENWLLARCCGQLFLTVHNILPHDAHTRWNQWVHTVIYRVPHRLMVHTELMKVELVKRFRVPAGRVVVVEHGIDDLGPKRAAVLPEAKRAPVIHVLFFGVVRQYKGLDLLLRAFMSLDASFRLSVVGMCRDPAYAAELQRLIDANPVPGRIEWRNTFVEEHEIPGIFAKADVLALPYRHIDQSGVVFQALRHGVPIVATNVGSLVQYVTPQVGIVVEHAEPGAVAEGLKAFALARDRFDRAEIAATGCRYLWSTTVKPLLALYRSAGVPLSDASDGATMRASEPARPSRVSA